MGVGLPSFNHSSPGSTRNAPNFPPETGKFLAARGHSSAKTTHGAFAKGSGLRGGPRWPLGGLSYFPGGAGAGQSTHLGQPGVRTEGRQWIHVTAGQIPAGPTGSPKQDPQRQ